MDKRPIGVFDSGLGGLSAVKEIEKFLPNEDIIYFGDTLRVPYGTRSNQTITKFALQDINFLKTFDVKAVLVACGTVSSVALDDVKKACNFDVIGVVESTVVKATNVCKNNKIAVIGTSATVKSKSYETAIHKINENIEILSVACPLFVPLVENGHISKDDEIVKQVVKLYLSKIKEFKADTLILGCTHYPILADAIQNEVGSGVILVNSGYESAKFLTDLIKQKNIENNAENKGTKTFYVSDRAQDFATVAKIFLNDDIKERVKKIDIE